MILFDNPGVLLLMFPLLAAVLIYYMRQRRGFITLSSAVADRFLPCLSSFTKKRIVIHSTAVFIMGLLLVLAGAEPYTKGKVSAEVQEKTIVFLIDASFSMYANDVIEIEGVGKPADRKELATLIARSIMQTYPHYTYGLVSFSGVAAIHSPPTTDVEAVKSYLSTFKIHMFQKTGTDFNEALNTLLHFSERNPDEPFQVVLISDGEEKEGNDYDVTLSALASRGIVVHTVGVGTKSGGGIYVYNPKDLLLVKKNPTVIVEATSYRVDDDLEKIAEKTNGIFIVADSSGSIKKLITAIGKTESVTESSSQEGKRDLSGWFVFIFAVLFIADTCWVRRNPILEKYFLFFQADLLARDRVILMDTKKKYKKRMSHRYRMYCSVDLAFCTRVRYVDYPGAFFKRRWY